MTGQENLPSPGLDGTNSLAETGEMFKSGRRLSKSHSKLEQSLNSLSLMNAKGNCVCDRSWSQQRTQLGARRPATEQPSLWSYTRRQLLTLAAVAYGNFWVAACVSLQAPFFPVGQVNRFVS